MTWLWNKQDLWFCDIIKVDLQGDVIKDLWLDFDIIKEDMRPNITELDIIEDLWLDIDIIKEDLQLGVA